MEFFKPLIGGVFIGVAVTLMLLFNGRVTGISGIINSAVVTRQKDSWWRWSFLGGLIAGGLILAMVNPGIFLSTTGSSNLEIGIAGLLVGFGTVMGSGCTSGHGVCGISRFSRRSIFATVAFIVSGVLVVTFLKGIL